MSATELLASHDKMEARELAERIRLEARMFRPPIDVIEIAEGRGFKLLTAELGGADTYGAIDGRSKSIYVNGEATPENQAFAIAYLIGKFMFDRSETDPLDENLLAVTRADLKNRGSKVREFARELLAPKERVAELRYARGGDVTSFFVAPRELIDAE